MILKEEKLQQGCSNNSTLNETNMALDGIKNDNFMFL